MFVELSEDDFGLSDSDLSGHEGEGHRPLYPCPFEGCGKQYSKPCRLEEHVRAHTGERPYTCPHVDCGKSYIRENHLKRHMLIHTGEKPYGCTHTGCMASYHTSYHLKRHMRVHEKARAYVVCVYALADVRREGKFDGDIGVQ